MAAAVPNSIVADTIYALSSGRPPAAIAIMRISGPAAREALVMLAGVCPLPRVATLRTLHDATGEPLDRALVLWFPAPASATGEDVAELHLHGSAAVVRAVSQALAAQGLREAEPGEFTRRALLEGRLDLDGVEALADLLAAETETQRREAILRTTGAIAKRLAGWAARLTDLSAMVEAAIDYDDSDETAGPVPYGEIARLYDDISGALAAPSAERLRDGIRVAIVGPVNAGKSSLFNALIGQDTAIVSAIPGTTRDVVERTIVIDETVFVLSDTAGLRETTDVIERIGIDRARQADRDADLVIDLAADALCSESRIAVSAKCDLVSPRPGALAVSARTGVGIQELVAEMLSLAQGLLPADGEPALQRRHRQLLTQVVEGLASATAGSDLVLCAEYLAQARQPFVSLGDASDTDAMLDALFNRFCLGK